MKEMTAVPLGCTCLHGGGREQQKSTEGEREPGDLVWRGPVPRQAGDGTPREAESPQPEAPKFWWVLTLIEHLLCTRQVLNAV